MGQQEDQGIQIWATAVKIFFDSNLARELLETGNKHLAESGRNHHQTCGLSITHNNILDRSSDTGNNRLGELLMDIRKTLGYNL